MRRAWVVLFVALTACAARPATTPPARDGGGLADPVRPPAVAAALAPDQPETIPRARRLAVAPDLTPTNAVSTATGPTTEPTEPDEQPSVAFVAHPRAARDAPLGSEPPPPTTEPEAQEPTPPPTTEPVVVPAEPPPFPGPSPSPTS